MGCAVSINNSYLVVNNYIGKDGTNASGTLANRLREDNIASDRAIQVGKSKNAFENGWSEPENGCKITSMAQEGNYGVVAWGKLLVFDIDIYGDGEQGVISRAHVNPIY